MSGAYAPLRQPIDSTLCRYSSSIKVIRFCAYLRLEMPTIETSLPFSKLALRTEPITLSTPIRYSSSAVAHPRLHSCFSQGQFAHQPAVLKGRVFYMLARPVFAVIACNKNNRPFGGLLRFRTFILVSIQRRNRLNLR